jgi:hypothetical protein
MHCNRVGVFGINNLGNRHFSMITTLSQLAAHAKRMAEEFPQDAAEIALCAPGLSDLERVCLQRALTRLPATYLDCATEFQLRGVRSGYFALWPEAFDSGDLTKTLLRANSPENPFYAQLTSIGCLQVASWEASPIAVGGIGSSREAQVLLFSVATREGSPVVLAQDFEKFMLLVGNLDEAANDLQGTEALEAFRLRVLALTSSDSIWAGWKLIAETVLLG